jgi:hypothetical protein
MSLEIYKASVAQLYASLGDIAANVAYIQDKLPDCNPPDIERSRIDQTCRDFDGAIYDVRKEIRNLEDKLGMRTGQPPFDPDIMNPDPRVTMGFISRWLWTEITAMHQTVLRLEEASKIAHGDGGAYLLVAESAVNIFHDYEKVREALDAIEAQLGPKK